MTRRELLDWDRLAPVWRRFESTGLTPEQLQRLLPEVHGGSCVVVGSGQGYLASRLAAFQPLVPIDSSLAMVLAGIIRRGLTGVVGEGRRLPLRDAWAQSCIIATGVLNPKDLQTARSVLREARRILADGGRLVVAAFIASGSWVAAGVQLGLIVDGEQRNDRLLQLYVSPASKRPTLVANWLQVSLCDATRRLEENAMVVHGLVDLFDRVWNDLEERSIKPMEHLEASYGRPFPIFDEGRLRELVEGSGLEATRAADDLRDWGIALLLCRKALRDDAKNLSTELSAP